MSIFTALLTLALSVAFGSAALAQTSAASPPAEQQPSSGETPTIFGWGLPDSDHLRISGTFIAGWSHDGAQAALGFEKQGRVSQATIALSGRITDRVRYFVSFNPVNEVHSKPACGEADFFFPNNPAIYAAGPLVPCDPERGHKRVDTYNTLALDYITQQGPLREGYVDWRATESITARFGRFILPVGFAPLEVGSWTAKDLTRIQRLNAEANFGLLLGYNRRDASGRAVLQAAVMGVLGEGNREKDYNWFYFADTSLDTNSALTAIGSVRAQPLENIDLRVAYKLGFTGSKVERLPSYWASKRNDRTFTAGARIQVHPMLSVFGEYARYVWGPTDSSAEMLGIEPDAIEKPGYYVGATFEAPVTSNTRAGVTVTREEISRDDSLIKYLQLNGLYGVEMGKKDRGTIARFYVDVSRLVTFGVFWADISNPYPWVSGSWPVSGPRAFTGRAPDRYGVTVVVRTP
jgi:hypothetical protein